MYSLTLVIVSAREGGLLIKTCFANYWSIDIIMSIRVWKVSRCGSSCLFSLSLSLPLLAGDLQEGQMWVNIQLHPNHPLPHRIPQRLIVRHIYILWTFLEQEMHGNWLFCPFKEYILWQWVRFHKHVNSDMCHFIFCIYLMLGRFLEQQMWIYRPCCVFSSFSENTLEKMYFNGNWIFILSADTLLECRWILIYDSALWSGKGGEQTAPLSRLTNICGVGEGGSVDGLLVP